MTAAKRSFIAAAGVVALLGVRSPALANQQPEPPAPTTPGGESSAPPAPSSAPPSPAPPPPADRAAPEPRPSNGGGPESVPAATPGSWFARPPLTIALGQGADTWKLTFFGFVEADYMFDTTRSYEDAIGASLVARSDTYAGRASRTQFSMRNTRIGMMFESPRISGMAPSAVFEGDFFGHQSIHLPDTSEAAVYASPLFRVRHAYLKVASDIVDVVAGQTYDVFGWQNSYAPCTVQFLGLPNQLFSRNMQLRVSRNLQVSSAFSIDLAASAVRPAQRDSGVPDANAGVRFNIDSWKGITTPGNIGTRALPLSLGLSGTVRSFRANAFTPPPTQNSNNATGWGLSADALIPIIPAEDASDRGNRLTLIGSFVVGTGIADLITGGGGATFPTLRNPAQDNPPPTYHGNIDYGLVSFDVLGVLHTIDWQAFKVGLQYYLPPAGRIILSANYTQGYSKNLHKLFPAGGTEVELLGRIADTSRYADVNVFWDATPAVRLGLSGQYTQVEYLPISRGGAVLREADKPHNVRVMAQALYAF
jgi:hypothetical protein